MDGEATAPAPSGNRRGWALLVAVLGPEGFGHLIVGLDVRWARFGQRL